MSLFGKIFGGGGKGGKGPSPQEAIQKLRETEEMLTKKQEFLEKKIDQELQIAKKNGMKNKRGERSWTEFLEVSTIFQNFLPVGSLTPNISLLAKCPELC